MMGKLGGIMRAIIWVKGSIFVALFGAYIAYENHQSMKEVEYNIFEKKQPVAESFFPDPPGLNAKWESNIEGEIETFLRYSDMNGNISKIEVMEDMLPKNSTMVDGLKQRLESGVDKESYAVFTDNKDFTQDYLGLALKDLASGKSPSKEQLDQIIKDSFDLFKSAYKSKYNGESFSQESLSIDGIGLVVEKNSNGENELYLTFNDNGESYKISAEQLKQGRPKKEQIGNLDFGKYEKMLGPMTKERVTVMFNDFLDNLYTQYQKGMKKGL